MIKLNSAGWELSWPAKNQKAKRTKKMNIKLNHSYFPASKVSIPEGEPFREFRSHADGSRQIWPLGRFIILQDSEEWVWGGGERWEVYIPAGTYEMVEGGSIYCHAIIRRVGDIPF